MYLPYQKSPAIQALKERAKKEGIPLYGTFELTSRCNLDCKMCYVHGMNSNQCRDRELSTEQWKHIMDQAVDAGMMFALLTGGECLLRSDFRELYLYLYHKGVIPSVNTNGTLINDDFLGFFATNQPERLQISLYGSNDDGYERVTGHRQYEKVKNAILRLRDAGVNVEVAITPNAFMKADVEGIYRFLKQEKVPFQVSNMLIEPREGEAKDESYLSPEERIELDKIKADVFGKTLRTPVYPVPKACGDQNHCVEGMPCNAGTIRFCITWEGKMIPCISIPEISIDARTQDFADCWEYIHSTMAKVLQPVECEGCPYHPVCGLCPVLKYDGLFSGHCKKSHCDYLEKRYEAGLLYVGENGMRSL